MVQGQPKTVSGGEAYSTLSLKIYDYLVLTFNTNYLWRCSCKDVLVPFFAANAGACHMDIGVGNGYFPATLKEREKLANRSWPEKLTLIDVNPACLETAFKRVGLPEQTTCLQADILKPIVLPPDTSDPKKIRQFDSISLMYVFHCLPVPTKRKTHVFADVKKYLSPGGTLFGATVLGKGVPISLPGRMGMWFLNYKGVFWNREDGPEEFVQALEAEFDEVETTVVGCVLLFRARKPKLAT